MPELTVFGELFWGGLILIAAGFVCLFALCVAGGAFYEHAWKQWVMKHPRDPQ